MGEEGKTDKEGSSCRLYDFFFYFCFPVSRAPGMGSACFCISMNSEHMNKTKQKNTLNKAIGPQSRQLHPVRK